jgi:hypothetical protein
MKRSTSGIFLGCLAAAIILTGCTGGRNIHYAPVVRQNLGYLQDMSKKMAESAAAESPKFSPGSTERKPILTAISRSIVREVGGSVGGFYLVGDQQYEGIYEGGTSARERDLDPVEKAQLDVLVEQVLQNKRYQEMVNSFYEHEVAQVASPVFVDGQVAAVAWIRYALPSAIKSITEENKFDKTSTSHSNRSR